MRVLQQFEVAVRNRHHTHKYASIPDIIHLRFSPEQNKVFFLLLELRIVDTDLLDIVSERPEHFGSDRLGFRHVHTHPFELPLDHVLLQILDLLLYFLVCRL